jgi:hypothetical protein
MKNAFEYEVEYDGKHLKRRRLVIGPILLSAAVALCMIWRGVPPVNIPAVFWEFLKRWH